MRSLVSSFRHRYQRSLEHRTAQLDSETRQELAAEVLNGNEEQQRELEAIETQMSKARDSLSSFVERELFLQHRLTVYEEKLAKQEAQLKEADDMTAGEAAPHETTLAHERETLLEDKQHQGETAASHAAGEKFDDEYEPVESSNNDHDEDEEDSDDEETGEVERNPFLHASIEERDRFRAKLKQDQQALETVQATHRTMKENIRELKKKIMVMEEKKRIILDQTQENRDFLVAAAMADQAEDDGFYYEEEDTTQEQTSRGTEGDVAGARRRHGGNQSGIS